MKRPRTDDVRGRDGHFVPTKDRNIWFDGGTVVLVADNIAFRLHKGLLSEFSAYFGRLFDEPQPAAPTEGFDGAQVVRLTDKAEDIARLLRLAIHGSKRLQASERVDFPLVASWIRMGHKYERQDICAKAMERLVSFFSDNLKEWLVAHASYGTPLISVMPEEAVGAVNLARLTGTLTILPSALYMCCQLSSKDLLRGVTLSDGTIEKLNEGDVERCFDAREEVMRQNINSMLRLWQPDTARACSTPTFCKHAL
ncbi:uncharacterized protein C8Q71DRAFT_710409, partial [Rhodofomes roseus]